MLTNPGPLSALSGIWVEEIDALSPEQSNRAVFNHGSQNKCNLVCDLIHLEGAKPLAVYECDFYAGQPAVTKNKFGKGFTYYIGTRFEKEGLANVLELALADADVKPIIEETTELEITVRTTDNYAFYFVINFKDKDIMLPSCFIGKLDLLTGETVKEGHILSKYDVKIICVNKE